MLIKNTTRSAHVLLVSTLAIFLPTVVIACGIVVLQSGYGKDAAESAFIHYENGTEKLIIGRDFNDGAENAVWVIPIPASPDSVELDVISDLPDFQGENIEELARDNISDIRDLLLATQLYPIAPLIYSEIMSATLGGITIPSSLLDNSRGSGVTTHQRLEKEGLISEVLSTTDSDALYSYLKNQNLDVEKDSIAVLNEYIGKDFSFVASWVAPKTTENTRKGLLMTFPTKEIFYPLKPGSAYSGPGFPETIHVIGYVTPKLFADIKNKTTVEYFHSKNSTATENFFSSDTGFGFTKIVITAEPKALVEDLYISTTTPIRIQNATLLNSGTVAYGIIMYVIISFAATLLAFIYSARNKNSSPRDLLALLASSLLGIVGTIIGSRFFLKEKRFRFVALYSLTFVLLTFVVWYLIFNWY